MFWAMLSGFWIEGLGGGKGKGFGESCWVLGFGSHAFGDSLAVADG